MKVSALVQGVGFERAVVSIRCWLRLPGRARMLSPSLRPMYGSWVSEKGIRGGHWTRRHLLASNVCVKRTPRIKQRLTMP